MSSPQLTVELVESLIRKAVRAEVLPAVSDILTLEQAAKYLQLCTKTVAQMATDKEIPAKRIRREWRFSRAALLRFIDGTASP